MGFLYTPLPLWLVVAGSLAAAGMIVLAGFRKPFHRIAEPALQHLWLGMIVAIAVLWTVNVWLGDGPVMHLLGATLMVTLFDWALALIAMAAVLGLVAVILGCPWEGIGLTFVIFGAVPVVVSALLQRAIAKWLPRHFSFFILGHGFVTAALALCSAAAAAVGIHMILHRAVAGVIPSSYWPGIALLMCGEAWFCGMLTTIFAVYRPTWVTTYDQRLYRLHSGPRT
jgi:uncharacterized membrane protein